MSSKDTLSAASPSNALNALRPSPPSPHSPLFPADPSADHSDQITCFLDELIRDPTAAWAQTKGRPLLVRVLKVKRMFRVSYKTVLYRLVATGQATNDVWSAFQHQHRRYFGGTLEKADEPAALKESEFAWHWGRSGEPDRLSEHDFVEDRLSCLVRRALQEGHISLGRGGEILGLSREQMRQRVGEWAN